MYARVVLNEQDMIWLSWEYHIYIILSVISTGKLLSSEKYNKNSEHAFALKQFP